MACTWETRSKWVNYGVYINLFQKQWMLPICREDQKPKLISASDDDGYCVEWFVNPIRDLKVLPILALFLPKYALFWLNQQKLSVNWWHSLTILWEHINMAVVGEFNILYRAEGIYCSWSWICVHAWFSEIKGFKWKRRNVRNACKSCFKLSTFMFVNTGYDEFTRPHLGYFSF